MRRDGFGTAVRLPAIPSQRLIQKLRRPASVTAIVIWHALATIRSGVTERYLDVTRARQSVHLTLRRYSAAARRHIDELLSRAIPIAEPWS
jgi:hypothetical protein